MRHGRVAGMKLRDGPVRRQVREQPWAALGSPGLIGCGLSKPFLRGSKEMRRQRKVRTSVTFFTSRRFCLTVGNGHRRLPDFEDPISTEGGDTSVVCPRCEA